MINIWCVEYISDMVLTYVTVRSSYNWLSKTFKSDEWKCLLLMQYGMFRWQELNGFYYQSLLESSCDKTDSDDYLTSYYIVSYRIRQILLVGFDRFRRPDYDQNRVIPIIGPCRIRHILLIGSHRF